MIERVEDSRTVLVRCVGDCYAHDESASRGARDHSRGAIQIAVPWAAWSLM